MRPDAAALGKDAGALAGIAPAGVAIRAELSASVDVLVDFSGGRGDARAAAGVRGAADSDGDRHDGPDGGGPGTHQQAAAATIPVLQATNTSLGINVLLAVAAQVARQLGEGYDIEIVEAHHNQKKDAPSGTALSLAESICAATGRKIERDLIYGRGTAPVEMRRGARGASACTRFAWGMWSASIRFITRRRASASSCGTWRRAATRLCAGRCGLRLFWRARSRGVIR